MSELFIEVMKQRERMCKQFCDIECNSCPITYDSNGHHLGCRSFIIEHPQEAESLIMKWASEHPIKTNADVFKEVFGTGANNLRCPFTFTDICKENKTCSSCEYEDFWNQEYKEPKGVE